MINIKKVLEFAIVKHWGQTRADGSDYIMHPIRVAKLINEHKSSKNKNLLLAAALLHDVLEDTNTSYKELVTNFGEDVASIVMEVTTASYVPKLIGKKQYLAQKMENMTSYALTIKLADRYDNITDLKGVSDDAVFKTLSDTRYIINYLKDKVQFTSSQQKFINLIDDFLKQKGYY